MNDEKELFELSTTLKQCREARFDDDATASGLIALGYRKPSQAELNSTPSQQLRLDEKEVQDCLIKHFEKEENFEFYSWKHIREYSTVICQKFSTGTEKR